MSDRDAMLIRKGAALALGYAVTAMAGTGLALRNATPDLIACSPTVRR